MRKGATCTTFWNTVKNGWSPEQMWIADMGTAVPRTPCLRPMETAKPSPGPHADADSIHRKYGQQLPLPASVAASSSNRLQLTCLLHSDAQDKHIEFPCCRMCSSIRVHDLPNPSFSTRVCLSFFPLCHSLIKAVQVCRSFVPLRCGGTQTGHCHNWSKRRSWVIDPRYGDIMGVCHLSGQSTPAGWRSVSNSGLLASVALVSSFYPLILITYQMINLHIYCK